MLGLVFFFSIAIYIAMRNQNDGSISPALNNSLVDPSYSNKPNYSNKPDNVYKGYVRVNGFIVLIIKSELTSLI